MSDENRTEGTDGDGPDHTGHDKYRPINLQSDRSVRRGSHRGRQSNPDSGEADSMGRYTRGARHAGPRETRRDERRSGSEPRAGNRGEGPTGGDDAHRAASERHGGERGGRPSDRRRYDSRAVQQGRTSGNPGVGSQRGSHREEGVGGRLGGHRGDDRTGPGDDQESLGERYRYGGERGGSTRDRRYGSRRGNSVRRDPRRE